MSYIGRAFCVFGKHKLCDIKQVTEDVTHVRCGRCEKEFAHYKDIGELLPWSKSMQEFFDFIDGLRKPEPEESDSLYVHIKSNCE